jgi:perilipin-2
MENSTETVDSQKTGALPHLECIDKMWKIPLVEMAWNQSAEMYGKVKEAHEVFNWTLSTAEAAVLKAIEQAAPIAKKLEQPIHAVDQTLCKGLEIVEEKLPLVKEPPSHVSSLKYPFIYIVLELCIADCFITSNLVFL